jgi:heat shock protein 5
MGRTFDDQDVQKDRKHWPFKLANKGGKPMVQVDHRGDTKDFVSSLQLDVLESS